jgi:hypothetical protein
MIGIGKGYIHNNLMERRLRSSKFAGFPYLRQILNHPLRLGLRRLVDRVRPDNQVQLQLDKQAQIRLDKHYHFHSRLLKSSLLPKAPSVKIPKAIRAQPVSPRGKAAMPDCLVSHPMLALRPSGIHTNA